MELSEALRTLRAKHNYTQEFVAEKVGVHYTNYGKYESGKTIPKFNHAKKLADLYNLSLDDLYNYGKESGLYRAPEYEKKVLEDGVINGYKKAKNSSVSVMIELDGSDESEKKWIQMIKHINQAVKATI